MPSLTNLSDEAVFKRFEDFCDGVNTTFSHQARTLLRTNPAGLKDHLPNPGLYDDAESFAKDWQCYSFLKKFKGLPGTSPSERKATAIRGWSAAEKVCFLTNDRITRLLRGDTSLLDIPLRGPESSAVTMATIISMAQRKIESVLGPFNFKKVTQLCKWSNGATADKPRGTQLSKKMTEDITVTARCLPHLRKVMTRDPGWVGAILGRDVHGYCSPLPLIYRIVRSSRFLTVPKTAFTDRCIAAEPTGNAFLQQGAGRYLRNRLKRVGVDLDDQSFNQWMASIACSLGYSTLDLQSASDSIATALVRLLLPERWFSYLSDLRTSHSRVDGKEIRLEKFSSMGNAFTFELESLIFWALAQSVNEALGDHGGMVAVYGDDIVCKRAIFDTLVSVLKFAGFTVNSKKSYKDGAFFESCGANYFLGQDVTGFQQEESLTSLEEIIGFHNRSVRWSMRIFGTPFSPVCKRLVAGLSDGIHVVPFSEESDAGFLSPVRDLGEFCPNRGYKCRVRQFVPHREVMYKQRAFYAYKLRRPHESNAHPKGWPEVSSVDSGTWVSAYRWIHRKQG